MNIHEIKLLFTYHSWANQRLLAKVAQLSEQQYLTPSPNTYGSLRQTFVHMVDTEYGWRNICQYSKITPDMTEEDLPTLAGLEQRWHEEAQAMRDYIARLSDDDLANVVRYNVGDEVRERVLWHCLFHIINHGTQHRSETAALLTAYDQSPGDLDFTVFLREQAS